MRVLHFYGFFSLFFTIITSSIFLYMHDHCAAQEGKDDRCVIVCTTTIIADAVRSLGGNHVTVVCLMGPGVDPHTYRAREGDVHRMAKADIIFYNGLHLEGRMQELMGSIARTINTVAVADALDATSLRFLSDGVYDPHVWHDVSLWRKCVQYIAECMIKCDQKNADDYRYNLSLYDQQLAELDSYCKEKIAQLPSGRRIVVTAHDAFYYCAQRYHFSVIGLQGMSTEAEVTMHDIEHTIQCIVAHKIPTIFVESSVSQRALQAVQKGVAASGFAVALGDELYSDALGDCASCAPTYYAMIKHNIDAIVKGLLV